MCVKREVNVVRVHKPKGESKTKINYSREEENNNNNNNNENLE